LSLITRSKANFKRVIGPRTLVLTKGVTAPKQTGSATLTAPCWLPFGECPKEKVLAVTVSSLLLRMDPLGQESRVTGTPRHCRKRIGRPPETRMKIDGPADADHNYPEQGSTDLRQIAEPPSTTTQQVMDDIAGAQHCFAMEPSCAGVHTRLTVAIDGAGHRRHHVSCG
jgi:hypothetical protein